MGARINAIGQRYGRFLVLGDAGIQGKYDRLVSVVCDCGTKKVVLLKSLRSGRSTSCGCRNIEVATEAVIRRNTKHGMHGTPTYNTWINVIARCTNPSNPAYPEYGGRGITICDRWRDSFENFHTDMGDRPVGMTLDRRDNNRGYEPGNCRWLSRKGQARNTRRNLIIEFQGITATLAEQCERLGLAYSTIISRLKRGWPVERALSESIRGGL